MPHLDVLLDLLCRLPANSHALSGPRPAVVCVLYLCGLCKGEYPSGLQSLELSPHCRVTPLKVCLSCASPLVTDASSP